MRKASRGHSRRWVLEGKARALERLRWFNESALISVKPGVARPRLRCSLAGDIERYRRLLGENPTEAERKVLERLLAEEEVKGHEKSEEEG